MQRLESIEDLIEYLDALEFMMSRKSASPIKLVVIDSIAACVRSDYDPTVDSLQSRSQKLFSVSSKLRQLGEKFAFAILVIYQVTADMSNGKRKNLPLSLSLSLLKQNTVLSTHYNGLGCLYQKTMITMSGQHWDSSGANA